MSQLTESKLATPGHTPGPWRAFGHGGCKSIVDADKAIIAEMVINGDLAQTKANTLLLAAAPDMLAALQFLRREYLSPSSDVLLTDEAKDRIDAAIAKATGGASCRD